MWALRSPDKLGSRQEVSLSRSSSSRLCPKRSSQSSAVGITNPLLLQKSLDEDFPGLPVSLTYLKLASVFTSPRWGVSTVSCLFFFFFVKRKQRRNGASLCFSPIPSFTPSPSRVWCWLLTLSSVFHKWHYSESRWQIICDSSGLEIKLLWLALIT